MMIIENAKEANRIWNSLPQINQEKLSKYFHLRPTNSGITIVSTHPFFPMRGIICDKESLNEILNKIYIGLPKIFSVDKSLVITQMKEIGFKERTKSSDERFLEEDVQALMINSMSNDYNLQKKLNAKSTIQFIASEFIFDLGEEKGNRIDIIGYDGHDLYFFELKKDRTTKVNQVKEYVDYYSRPEKMEIMEEILTNYPSSHINKNPGIKGIMIMQNAENHQSSKWKKLESDNDIKILFFEKSLRYYVV